MGAEIIGILVIFVGIWQIYAGRKMYYNIKDRVKAPQPYMFVGVYISLITGIAFLVGGAFLIK